MMRILHVDDQAVFRALVKIGLELNPGWSVVSCCSGPEAIAVLRAGVVDAIVTDVMMPDMSGISLAQTIRNEGLSTAPLLFLTGGGPFSWQSLTALSPAAILGKPFDPVGLGAQVREILRARAPRAVRPLRARRQPSLCNRPPSAAVG